METVTQLNIPYVQPFHQFHCCKTDVTASGFLAVEDITCVANEINCESIVKPECECVNRSTSEASKLSYFMCVCMRPTQ